MTFQLYDAEGLIGESITIYGWGAQFRPWLEKYGGSESQKFIEDGCTENTVQFADELASLKAVDPDTESIRAMLELAARKADAILILSQD